MVKVQVFYDPQRIGYTFFKSIYDGFGLKAPTPKEMVEKRSKSNLPSGREIEIGWAVFSPLPKDRAKKLTDFFLDHSIGITSVEVNELETL